MYITITILADGIVWKIIISLNYDHLELTLKMPIVFIFLVVFGDRVSFPFKANS